jgi:prophage regulatory protein
MQLVHQSRPVVPRDRLVRLPEVEGMTGLRKSTAYKLIGEGKFPKPVRLGTRMVAWSEAAVLQWVQDRIAESQGGTA